MGELRAVVKGPPHRALPLHFYSLARSTLRELRRPLLNPLVLTERVSEVVIAHASACREDEGRYHQCRAHEHTRKAVADLSCSSDSPVSGSVSI